MFKGCCFANSLINPYSVSYSELQSCCHAELELSNEGVRNGVDNGSVVLRKSNQVAIDL